MLKKEGGWTTVCDRCNKTFSNWEDDWAKGRIYIDHSSVIGDIFSEGAEVEMSRQRNYFNKHQAVRFGEHPHQSLILEYGGENGYHLCWHCNRDFIKLLGNFFRKQGEQR